MIRDIVKIVMRLTNDRLTVASVYDTHHKTRKSRPTFTGQPHPAGWRARAESNLRILWNLG
jgi:hypothetical protein